MRITSLKRAATAAERRRDAEYRPHARTERCDTCANVCTSRLANPTRYDRWCSDMDAPVKTHGSCTEYEPALDAECDEFPSQEYA